jgi:phosphonate transport system substrate-binding protein
LLSITTCQAPNSNAIVEGLATYLAAQLNDDVRLLIDMPWQARADRLEAGEIDLGWVCGLPYTHNADAPDPVYELLATPVRSADRYGNQPVYFSDVVVREAS